MAGWGPLPTVGPAAPAAGVGRRSSPFPGAGGDVRWFSKAGGDRRRKGPGGGWFCAFPLIALAGGAWRSCRRPPRGSSAPSVCPGCQGERAGRPARVRSPCGSSGGSGGGDSWDSTLGTTMPRFRSLWDLTSDLCPTASPHGPGCGGGGGCRELESTFLCRPDFVSHRRSLPRVGGATHSRFSTRLSSWSAPASATGRSAPGVRATAALPASVAGVVRPARSPWLRRRHSCSQPAPRLGPLGAAQLGGPCLKPLGEGRAAGVLAGWRAPCQGPRRPGRKVQLAVARPSASWVPHVAPVSWARAEGPASGAAAGTCPPGSRLAGPRASLPLIRR